MVGHAIASGVVDASSAGGGGGAIVGAVAPKRRNPKSYGWHVVEGDHRAARQRDGDSSTTPPLLAVGAGRRRGQSRHDHCGGVVSPVLATRAKLDSAAARGGGGSGRCGIDRRWAGS